MYVHLYPVLTAKHSASVSEWKKKKFDVDGAYNARYEIIKKRTDKAVVKELRTVYFQLGKSRSFIQIHASQRTHELYSFANLLMVSVLMWKH